MNSEDVTFYTVKTSQGYRAYFDSDVKVDPHTLQRTPDKDAMSGFGKTQLRAVANLIRSFLKEELA